jgi:hypothetical protein
VVLEEPQVSVGGLLDRNLDKSVHENTKYGGYEKQKNK